MLCKYIMKEGLLSPSIFSHTQTTQPLVMHSFVTSNTLPLGYEAQHRMSESERERETKTETTKRERGRIVVYVDKNKIHICVVKKDGFPEKDSKEGRKKGKRVASPESQKVTANSRSLTSL